MLPLDSRSHMLILSSHILNMNLLFQVTHLYHKCLCGVTPFKYSSDMNIAVYYEHKAIQQQFKYWQRNHCSCIYISGHKKKKNAEFLQFAKSQVFNFAFLLFMKTSSSQLLIFLAHLCPKSYFKVRFWA